MIVEIERLQSVLNTAVRLVANSSRCDHAFSLLRDRHWLPVSSASSTDGAWRSTGACTATLHPTCQTWSRRLLMQPSELVSDRLHPAQSQCHEQCRRSANGHSLRLAPAHGTDCYHRFVALILLLFLNDNWRHFYSIVLLTDTTLLGALFVLWHLRRPNLDVLA